MVDSKRIPFEDASFRQFPPEPEVDVLFVPPHIEEFRFPNGTRLLLVTRHDMPIVATQIVVNRGLDLQRAPGLATLTASMMFMGTQSRSALVLSDELEALGARYGAWADFDGMGLYGQSLQPRFAELFEILTDVARFPLFAEDDFIREQKKRLSSLAAENDVPDQLIDNAIGERLYPEGHPFHAPTFGDEESIRSLQSKDLSELHRQAFRPAHATVTIAGDITREAAIALVEKHFGDWTGDVVPQKELPEPRPLAKDEKRILLLDRPNSSQSTVALALVGIDRKNPDYDAVMVLNTLLGGQFSSRLNMNLREKHAYTYGAYSSVEPRRWARPWTAGAAITTDATAPAIREMFVEIERLRNELVPDKELQHTKTSMVRKLPARFETAGGTAQALGSLAVLDLPLDSFKLRQQRAAHVSPADVLRVARTYLRPEEMRIFIVGDASVIRDDVEKLGLGEIEIRSSWRNE